MIDYLSVDSLKGGRLDFFVDFQTTGLEFQKLIVKMLNHIVKIAPRR